MNGLARAALAALLNVPALGLVWGGEAQHTRLPASDRPLRITQRLEINPLNSTRTVVEGLCETQGLRQLRELMTRSLVEELWVFLPLQNDAACLWVEIGGAVRSESELSSVQADWAYLAALISRFREMRVYHFHPLGYFESCRGDRACNEYAMPLRAADVSPSGLADNLRYSMPSPGDIYFMMETTWQFERLNGDEGSFGHRVVSPYGVVEYGLTAAGKARYAENRGSRMEGVYIRLIAADALSDENLRAVAALHRKDLAAAVRALAAQMSNVHLTVTVLGR